MEYILFKQNGDLQGLRGSLPIEEENLIAIEWFEDYANITNPKLVNGVVVSGEIEIDIEALDREYTQRIDDLISTHVQKFTTRQIPIPQEILEEQQRLINEFHELTNKELKK